MAAVGNVKESATWVAGAALEPIARTLKLDVGGAIGSIFRIPYKVVNGGKALFGKSATQKEAAAKAAAEESLRKKFPNGSPGYW